MSPYAKVALSVLRLAAFGCVVLGLGLYATDLYLYLSQRPVSSPLCLGLKALPFLAAVVLYWKGPRLAEYLTKDLD
ncbi:MAG: hypothetical protein ABSG59_10485 [Verrucomicrobiota bacterium]|jgi:hypothetical protein